MRRRLLVPAAIAVAVAPLLTGCGPTGDEHRAELETAIVDTNPAIDGALVGFSSSGSSLRLSVKAYIPTAAELAPEELAAIVEAGLEAVWLATTEEPAFLSFGVVPTTKPTDATFVQQDVARFPDTGRLLDTDGGTSDGSFGFDRSTLVLRFGERP